MTAKPIKPRKTPVQARSAETVRIILEAAAHILERHGLEAYSTNAVAERAGVSIGSLYQYFPGKDSLTAALVERETATMLQEVAEIDAAADGAEGMRRLIAACVAHQMRRPALARLLDFEEQRLPLRDQDEGMAVRLRQAITDILRRLPTVVEDPGTTACDILSIMKGMIDGAGERGEVDLTDLQERVGRAVFGYLNIGPDR